MHVYYDNFEYSPKGVINLLWNLEYINNIISMFWQYFWFSFNLLHCFNFFF